MAFAATKYNNLAPYYLQIAFRDSDGYPVGTNQTPDTKTPNTVYGAYVVDGLINLETGVPVNPVIRNFGGQRLITSSNLPASDYGTPTFQLSQKDETLDAFLTKTAIDVATNTTRAIMNPNVTQKEWPQFIVMFSILITNSNTGKNEFRHYAYLNTEVKKTNRAGAAAVESSATNPNPLSYELTTGLSLRDVTGELLSGLATLVTEDEFTDYRSTNPVHICTYVKNGSATEFTLPYLPLSSTVTINASSNHMTVNGTVTAAASVSTTTGVVGVAAGTSGDIVVMTYETNFVETPS